MAIFVPELSETEDKILEAVNWDKLAKKANEKVKETVNEIGAEIAEAVKEWVQGNICNDVLAEARKMAGAMLHKVLEGSESAFESLMQHNRYYSQVLAYGAAHKLEPAVALQRMLLERHKEAFEKITVGNYNREIAELRTALEKEQFNSWRTEYCRSEGTWPNTTQAQWKEMRDKGSRF